MFMLLLASAGRAAAQFIVRSKRDWGLATNKRLWRWIATSIACYNEFDPEMAWEIHAAQRLTPKLQ